MVREKQEIVEENRKKEMIRDQQLVSSIILYMSEYILIIFVHVD